MPLTAPTPVRLDTDLAQGFRFSAASRARFGYLLLLEVGGVAFSADLPGRDPLSNAPLSAVGVLDLFDWNGGPDSPQTLHFNVSLANQGRVQQLLRDPLISGRDVKMVYVVYAHDAERNAYFQNLRPQTSFLQGRFVVNSGRVVFNASPSSDPTVPSPLNFKAYMSLIPAARNQFVAYSPSFGGTRIMSWIHNGPAPF